MNFGGTKKLNKCGVIVLGASLLIIIYLFWGGSLRPGSGSVSEFDQINLRKLLIGSIKAAQAGGLEVVEISKDEKFKVYNKGKSSSDYDPITDADFRSHCAMQRGLKRIFPQLNIISEEDESVRPCHETELFDLDPTVLQSSGEFVPDRLIHRDDITVWIDPLDATQEYTEKLFQYVTTMVCVAVRGVPTIGVIYEPFSRRTSWAWVGETMSGDLQTLTAERLAIKNPKTVIVSRSHTGDVETVTHDIFGIDWKIIKAGGAGYKIIQVVEGKANMYFHTTKIKKWDICAGNAIIMAMGGQMTTLKGEKIDYSDRLHVENTNGLLAAVDNHSKYLEQIINRGRS